MSFSNFCYKLQSKKFSNEEIELEIAFSPDVEHNICKMDKKKVIKELRILHSKLKKPISRSDVRKYSPKLDYGIRKCFGTYHAAYKEAGLNIDNNSKNLSENESQATSAEIPIASKRIVKDNEWLGRAAEYLVLAELLYQGYNATRMTMDTGIDIFAVKDDKAFYIQVKSTSYNTVKREVKLSVDSFSKNNGGNYFYVFVITDSIRQTRDILVLPSNRIEEILQTSIQNIAKIDIRLKIKKEEGRIFINNYDASFWKNRWEMIK